MSCYWSLGLKNSSIEKFGNPGSRVKALTLKGNIYQELVNNRPNNGGNRIENCTSAHKYVYIQLYGESQDFGMSSNVVKPTAELTFSVERSFNNQSSISVFCMRNQIAPRREIYLFDPYVCMIVFLKNYPIWMRFSLFYLFHYYMMILMYKTLSSYRDY